MEGTKKSYSVHSDPATIISIAVGIVVIVILFQVYFWVKKRLFGFAGEVSDKLDQGASTYGENTALAAATPSLLFAQARFDWLKSLGLAPGSNAWNAKAAAFPELDAWLDGAGPAGYTYGSAKYPEPETKGLFSTLADAF